MPQVGGYSSFNDMVYEKLSNIPYDESKVEAV